MARKQAITNEEVLSKLMTAGYITKTNIKERETEFAKYFDKKWNYGYRKDPITLTPRYARIQEYIHNYMIPIKIFKEVVSPRFKPQLQIGWAVRVRPRTKRKRKRNKWNQAVGNSQDWAHLGVGSGKKYIGDDIHEALGHKTVYARQHVTPNNQILIGNSYYVPNILASINTAKFVKEHYKKPLTYHWDKAPYSNPAHLFEYIKIKGEGVFGPKKLINGYITNVYVHFLYPKWRSRREARYEILFDTGAKGIWTNDYIDRVFDTDYELDEALMDGCKEKCHLRANCDHTLVHIWTEECNEPCNVSGKSCEAIYDYRNIGDTTAGKGLVDFDEE